MKKKFLTILITICLVLSIFPLLALAETDFTDLPEGAYGQALQKAVDNGLLVGENNKIMPKEPLTRAQMAAVISRAFGAQEKGNISAFTDVTEGAWYYSAMQVAFQMGVYQGQGQKLLPNAYITREQAFAVIARALKLDPVQGVSGSFQDADQVSSWAKGLVYAMVNAGYIGGDGTNLRPKDNITRQEFAVIFDKVIKTYVKTTDVVEAVSAGNVMVNTPGATLKNLTITGDLIIGDGVANGDVTLDNVTVTGRIVVRGGGQNSVHITNNSQIGSIIISKTESGAVRVVTEDGCEVAFTYIDDGKDDVILEGAFDSVSVACDVPVVAQNAKIGTVTVTAESASIKIDGTSIVASMEITESAAGATLTVSEGAKVTKLTSSADHVAIGGEGIITQATVSGDHTTVDTSGTKLTVSEGTTGVSQNGTAVDGGSTITTQPPTVGGGGGGGGSSSYTASVATYNELTAALNKSLVSAINITGSFTMTGGAAAADLEFDKPVTVASGVTLTVGGNIKLCAESRLTNNGTIVLEGEADSHEAIVIGALVVCDGGILTNHGTITVHAATCDSNRDEILTDENGDPILDGEGHEIHVNVHGPNGGLLRINGGTLNNYGTINVEQGALTADDADEADKRYWGGYIEVANASTLNNLSGATVNFAGAYLNIWADSGEALFNNAGTLNITYGNVIIGDNGTLEVTSTGVLDNDSADFAIGEYDEGYATEALLLIRGSAANTGTITVVQPGSNALVLAGTGSLDNNGSIVNNARINVMGALDTEDGTITNRGEFLVQYTPGVDDIAGKDNITCENDTVMQFFVFEDVAGLLAGLDRDYTVVIVKENLTITSGTTITVEEGCSLQVAQGVTLTNNGSIYLALCELAAEGDDQLQAELYIEGTLVNGATGFIQIAAVYGDEENYSGGESVLWVEDIGTVSNSGTITNYGRVTNVGIFSTTGTVTNNGHFFNLGTVNGTISGNAVIVP